MQFISLALSAAPTAQKIGPLCIKVWTEMGEVWQFENKLNLRERADGHFSFDETGRWYSAFHELKLVQNKTLLPKCKQTEKADKWN